MPRTEACNFANARAAAALLSKAQVWQMLEYRGYFEIGRLRQRSDGNWDCAAMIGPTCASR